MKMAWKRTSKSSESQFQSENPAPGNADVRIQLTELSLSPSGLNYSFDLVITEIANDAELVITVLTSICSFKKVSG
jgi:hypothetical protein